MTLIALIAVAALVAAVLLARFAESSYAGQWLGPVDAELQLYDADTVAASAASDSIDLGENFSPAPRAPVHLLVDVDALDETTGDETYVMKLQESADDANWSDAGLEFAVAATGTIVQVGGVAKRYVRAYLTLAGTTPSITLSAWLRHA